MSTENLICLASGFAFGAAAFFVFAICRAICRAKIHARRMRQIPRGAILFRP